MFCCSFKLTSRRFTSTTSAISTEIAGKQLVVIAPLAVKILGEAKKGLNVLQIQYQNRYDHFIPFIDFAHCIPCASCPFIASPCAVWPSLRRV
jgi:hypothetical protein